MKKQLYLLMLISLFFLSNNVYINAGSDLSSAASGLGGTFSGIGTTFKNIGKSLWQSLGNAPDDWKYSFQVWNDTNKPVFGISQNIHSFMGARIIGGLQKMVPVLPYCSTEDAFYDLHMYMNIYICKDSFALKLATDLMGIVFDGTEAKAKNALGMSSVLQAAVSVGFSPINLFEGIADYELFSHYAIEVDGLSDSRVIMANMSNKLFEQAIDKDHQAGFYEHFRLAGEVPDFYRAYERNGETKVEFLSKRFTSTTFSGMIYNNAEAPVKVSFVKGGKAYTDIKLDPGSFNYINSSCGDGFDKSMRPSLFIFDLEGNNILDTDINDLKNKSKKENDAVNLEQLIVQIKKVIKENFNRKDIIWVAYNNFGFDQMVLEMGFKKVNARMPENWSFMDIFPLVKDKFKNIQPNYKLSSVYKFLVNKNEGINYHCSLDDCICLFEIFQVCTIFEDEFINYTRSKMNSHQIQDGKLSSLAGYNKYMEFERFNVNKIGDLYHAYRLNGYNRDEFIQYLKGTLNMRSGFYASNISKQIECIHALNKI